MSNFDFPPAAEVFSNQQDLFGLYVQHINDLISEALAQPPTRSGSYVIGILRLPGDYTFPRDPSFQKALDEAVTELKALGYNPSFKVDGRSGGGIFTIKNQTKEQRSAARYNAAFNAERELAEKQC